MVKSGLEMIKNQIVELCDLEKDIKENVKNVVTVKKLKKRLQMRNAKFNRFMQLFETFR